MQPCLSLLEQGPLLLLLLLLVLLVLLLWHQSLQRL